MKRLVFLIHRYLGIGISLLMSTWCISGIVMMYVSFPNLPEEERVGALEPLRWEGCCTLDEGEGAESPVDRFAVEMLAGDPVLRTWAGRSTRTVSLTTGRVLEGVDPALAMRIAAGYGNRTVGIDSPSLMATVERDQWTVSGFNAHRPLHRFALNDPEGTEIYVSGTTGEVVQDSTRHERFWNWFGAVTHWLYPTMLRQHAQIWSQVVIWTSIIGLFLAVTGIYIGISQFRSRSTGRWSPYRGYSYIHHWTGLVFGVLALVWVGSGLVSMNPWGFLEGSGSRAERERLSGMTLTPAMALGAVERFNEMPGAPLGEPPLIIESAPLAGRLFVRMTSASGTERREAGTMRVDPVEAPELEAVSSLLAPGTRIANASLLSEGDGYYYEHREARTFPVWRVILDDEVRTRYYLDTVTGDLLQKTDREGRWYRWLFTALHRWDFSQGLRARPVWDLVVIPLLLGVTALCLTGVYLAWRRLFMRPSRQSADAQGPEADEPASPRQEPA